VANGVSKLDSENSNPEDIELIAQTVVEDACNRFDDFIDEQDLLEPSVSVASSDMEAFVEQGRQRRAARESAYRRDVERVLHDAIQATARVLGDDHPAVAKVRSGVQHAPVNILSLRGLSASMKELRSALTYRTS